MNANIPSDGQSDVHYVAEWNCPEITEVRLRTVLRRELGVCENPTVGYVMKPSST